MATVKTTWSAAAETTAGEEREAFQRQAAKNEAEWARLRDECGRLRARMEEAEEAGRKENARLRRDNAQLNDALRQLRAASSTAGATGLVSASDDEAQAQLLAARQDASEVDPSLAECRKR